MPAVHFILNITIQHNVMMTATILIQVSRSCVPCNNGGANLKFSFSVSIRAGISRVLFPCSVILFNIYYYYYYLLSTMVCSQVVMNTCNPCLNSLNCESVSVYIHTNAYVIWFGLQIYYVLCLTRILIGFRRTSVKNNE